MPRTRRTPALMLLAVLAVGLDTVWADEPPPPTPPAPAKPAEPPKPAEPAKPVKPAKPVAPVPADPLVFGTFPVTAASVVDGDTVRPTKEKSVRILCLDTEEVFKGPKDKQLALADFAAYAKARRGDAPRPVKYGTPAGEAAKVFAQQLFVGVTRVRLERDELGGPEVDPYGRRLAHVIVLTPKGEINFAEAMIRAGHSPYFVKYGGSVRFDARFRAAEKEARTAKRGIWAETGPGHYPDYAERLVWWRAREAQVAAWRKVADRPDHVTLGVPGTAKKLAANTGKPVVVFGLFSRALETRDKSRKLIFLGDRRRRGFPLVFFDPAVHAALDHDRVEAFYIQAKGKVSLYKGRPQMVVERAEQISTK